MPTCLVSYLASSFPTPSCHMSPLVPMIAIRRSFLFGCVCSFPSFSLQFWSSYFMWSLYMTVKRVASSTVSHWHGISASLRISISRGKNLWYDKSGVRLAGTVCASAVTMDPYGRTHIVTRLIRVRTIYPVILWLNWKWSVFRSITRVPYRLCMEATHTCGHGPLTNSVALVRERTIPTTNWKFKSTPFYFKLRDYIHVCLFLVKIRNGWSSYSLQQLYINLFCGPIITELHLNVRNINGYWTWCQIL